MHMVVDPVAPGSRSEVTFDGGARAVGGRRVAGAGAILWGPAAADGARQPVARAVAALPAVSHTPEAEAWGCRIALELLAAAQPAIRHARVVGDCINVVRYGAGESRMRRQAVQSLLEGPLGQLVSAGWRLDWLVVRRQLNEAAHEAATEGVARAAARAAQGADAPQVEVDWMGGAAAAPSLTVPP